MTLLVVIACNVHNPVQQANQSIGTSDMIEYLKKLWSDEFLSRISFAKGEEITIDYLKKEFKDIGLKPAKNGSYLKEVPMVEVTVKPDKRMDFQIGDKDVSLRYKDDFIAFSRRLADEISLDQSEVVFAGFGINAPSLTGMIMKELMWKEKR